MQFVSTIVLALVALFSIVSAQSITIVPSSYSVVGGTVFTATVTSDTVPTSNVIVSLTYNGVTVSYAATGSGLVFVATIVAPLGFTGAGVLNASATLNTAVVTATSVAIVITAPVVPCVPYLPCYNPCSNPCYNPCVRRSRCGRYEDESSSSEIAVEFSQPELAPVETESN